MADMSTPGGSLRVVLDGEAPGHVVGAGASAEAGPQAGLVREVDPSPTDRISGRRRFAVVVDGWHFLADVEPAALAELRERARTAGAGHRVHERVDVRAQIPGRIVAVRVSQGEQVEVGQALLSIEAMKMENEVRATRAGTIARVAVAAGELVELGDELVVLE
jgi:biotin carboxyl carrier protein